MPAFTHRLRVAFGDVDHAGIVYYPRFFHYFHLAFEELFFTRLASDDEDGYRHVLDERRLGFPAVRAECDFKRPLRFGDWIEVQITADHVGTKSIALRYAIVAEATREVCAEGRVTCAVVDMRSFRSVPLPDDLRAIFEALR